MYCLFLFGSIKGHQEYIYTGDRIKEELIPYALRMSGPPVQQVTLVESVDTIKSQNPIFFVFVGRQVGILWDTYHSIAENFQAHGFFYATSIEVATRHFEIDAQTSILVYKERSHYFFPSNWNIINLSHFILIFLICSIDGFAYSGTNAFK